MFSSFVTRTGKQLSLFLKSEKRYLMAVCDHSVAFVTCPSEDVAKSIARGLVEKKLAACVNMIPKITSIYVWEGKVEEDEEVLLKIKTRTSVIGDISEYVRKNHPYDVPEVISFKIDQGNEAYLKWMTETVPERK